MSNLLSKLQWKDRTSLVILNPPIAFNPEIAIFKEAGIAIVKLEDSTIPPDCILVFCENMSSLSQSIKLITPYLKSDTLVWFCYPKKSSKKYASDITRDIGWDGLGALGYEPVRQISIDEDWSGLRFKPVSQIQNLTRNSEMLLSKEAKAKRSIDE